MKSIKLYTVKEVAEILNVTPRTVNKYISLGWITGQMIGGKWQFTEQAITDFMTGGKQKGVKGEQGAAAIARRAPELIDAIDRLNDFTLQAVQQSIASGQREGIEFDIAAKLSAIMKEHIEPMKRLIR